MRLRDMRVDAGDFERIVYSPARRASVHRSLDLVSSSLSDIRSSFVVTGARRSFVLRTPGRTSMRYPRDLRRRETCAAAGGRSDSVRLYSACRQKDPLVKSDRQVVGRLTDYFGCSSPGT